MTPNDGILSTGISVVVPVYGGGECLKELIARMDTCFLERKMDAPQVVLVDDCGPGDAWLHIGEIVETRSNVKAVQLLRNFGQHNALMCGFHYVTGDVVITIDDDLQHEPESIPLLVERILSEQLDLVYGSYKSKKHSPGRNLGSWLITRFHRIIFRTPVNLTAFRAIRRELVEAILRYDLNFTFIDGLLAWNTQRIGMVTVPHHARADGKSGYSFAKLISLAMNVFTNFSLLPLQLVSLIGLIAACCGLGLGLWYLIAAILARVAVPGYASTIVAVLVLGGLQLLSLGIMGEYLGRLHHNVNRKPQFTIRKIVSSAEPTEKE